MKYLLVLVLCLVPLQSCSSIQAAQIILEPYSFHIVGEASGDVYFNSRFLAVDAMVSATVVFSGPDGGLWKKVFDKEAGQRAYECKFGEDGPTVEPVEWDVAMASLNGGG